MTSRFVEPTRRSGYYYNVVSTSKDSRSAFSQRECVMTKSFNGSGFLSTAHVTLREKSYIDDADRESKLQRRTSYLMATGRQQTTDASAVSTVSSATSESSVATLTASTSDTHSQTPSPNATLVTQTKTSNIRKLKAFFGDKTSKVTEVVTDKRSQFDIPSGFGDCAIEGALSCKLASADGKRASDRSWKTLWVALKDNILFLFRDKSTSTTDDQQQMSIDVKGSMVDIAYDYTKKKNVFRLTTPGGSEYLFQADDQMTMFAWIKAIQAGSFPDESVCIDSSALLDVAVRKTGQPNEENVKTSPVTAAKNKKTSSITTKLKSPAPVVKTKKLEKNNGEKEQTHEIVESPKSKDKSTWKGRVARHFRRHGSSSSAPGDMPKMADVAGTFAIPLEMCVPGSINPLVPLVVEVCTQIVEEKGLNNQGIYRVPGNRGAVNQLHDELNKDPECLDMGNERWQDVNVVSSLLKLFFRELPDPLITEELYDSVIAANHTEDPTRRMLKIKKLIHDLPECNFETFHFIAQHLNLVASHEATNKMDARNLAIVFGPTLVRPLEDSMITMVKDMSDQCRITEMIIQHCHWFFGSWDEDVNVPVFGGGEDAMPVTGVNHEMLMKAELMVSGDRNRDLSAKDLVSSIFHAANKRIRRSRDKSTGGTGSRTRDSLEPDGTLSEPTSFSERNIDQEVELHRLKELLRASATPEHKSDTEKQVVITVDGHSSNVTSCSTSVGIVVTRTESDCFQDKTDEKNHSRLERDSSSSLLLAKARRSCFFENNSDVTTTDSVQKRRSIDAGLMTVRVGDTSPGPHSDNITVRWTSGPEPHDEVGHIPMIKVSSLSHDMEKQMQQLADDLQQTFHDSTATSARTIERRRVNAELCKVRAELERSAAISGSTVRKCPPDDQSVTSDYSTMSSVCDTREISLSVDSTPCDSLSSHNVSSTKPVFSFDESPPEFDTRKVADKGTLGRRRNRTEVIGTAAAESPSTVAKDKSAMLLPEHHHVDSFDSASDRSDHLSVSFCSHTLDSDSVDEMAPCDRLGSSPLSDHFTEQAHSTPGLSSSAPRSHSLTTDSATDSSSAEATVSPMCSVELQRLSSTADEAPGKNDALKSSDIASAVTTSDKDNCEIIVSSRDASHGDTLGLCLQLSLTNVLGKAFEQNISTDCTTCMLRDQPARQITRRHTLSSTGDLESFTRRKASLNCFSREDLPPSERLSAWQRLKPAVKDRLPDIGAWLARQRIHHVNSSPALLSCSPFGAKSFSPESLVEFHSTI